MAVARTVAMARFFPSRDHQHILDAFMTDGYAAVGMNPNAAPDIAGMLAAQGRGPEARTLLEKEVRRRLPGRTH